MDWAGRWQRVAARGDQARAGVTGPSADGGEAAAGRPAAARLADFRAAADVAAAAQVHRAAQVADGPAGSRRARSWAPRVCAAGLPHGISIGHWPDRRARWPTADRVVSNRGPRRSESFGRRGNGAMPGRRRLGRGVRMTTEARPGAFSPESFRVASWRSSLAGQQIACVAGYFRTNRNKRSEAATGGGARRTEEAPPPHRSARWRRIQPTSGKFGAALPGRRTARRNHL